ncbi:MAG TPA: shikimate dehydrogenase [Streptosporangiaceae bacterium]
MDRRSVRAAVLGSPIGHSLSPVLHTAAYAALGLTWWRYEAIECKEDGLPALLDRCGPDWAGLSLTMPLKRAVLPLLDRLDPLVTEVGAANTVLLAAEQRLGYNTDVPGMVRALREHGVGTSASTRAGEVSPRAVGDVGPAVILGGGATACAAVAAMRDLGERSVAVAVREPARAAGLMAAAERLGVAVQLRTFETASLGGARLIISTVPAAAAEDIARALAGLRPRPEVVFDVSYHPWPSALGRAAQQAGAVVVDGFELLLQQAASQVELMTGRPAPVAEMRAAGRTELSRRAQMAGRTQH